MDCNSTGLVQAYRIEGGYKYAFLCQCISGKRREERYPLWGAPTRGFVVSRAEVNERAVLGRQRDNVVRPDFKSKLVPSPVPIEEEEPLPTL